MDFVRLRNHLSALIPAQKDSVTHEQIPDLCKMLGLPVPGPEGSKRDRLRTSIEAAPDRDLEKVGLTYLRTQNIFDFRDRNALQDILWTDTSVPKIPKRYRREIARAIPIDELYLDGKRFAALLDKYWVLDEDPFGSVMFGRGHGLRERIDQHVYRNPGDWSVEQLFDELGILDATDQRFIFFLTELASGGIRPDADSIKNFVRVANTTLQAIGAEFREVGEEDGYPKFEIISLRAGVPGPPKNLIFASPVKPDIRFRSAIDNDIEIVTNKDKVLVYDRPIGGDGLRWRDLQDWWAEMNAMPDSATAKKTLYLRLKQSLPSNSPPQLALFEGFFECFKAAIPDLPVLLPEVWLHWDPKTVEERGRDALLRFRMDFLLLLPQGHRIVIEVDGKHHYANQDGLADAHRYGLMTMADRELKLAGYEVFRFGAAELQGNKGKEIVKDFFIALFKRYAIIKS